VDVVNDLNVCLVSDCNKIDTEDHSRTAYTAEEACSID
jgi:hypothetical protein